MRLNPFLSSIGIYLIYIHVEYAAKGHIIISKICSVLFSIQSQGASQILTWNKISRKKNFFGVTIQVEPLKGYNFSSFRGKIAYKLNPISFRYYA
ncbi:hypothetical protein, partial [Methanosarcina mazei]|uniref:hypothetical protein n=1 Tax=Methanosarcina mazei TaxID=2209 RepID=UPI001F36EDBF